LLVVPFVGVEGDFMDGMEGMKWLKLLEARLEPLDAKEVAKVLGISRQQVYKLAGTKITCARFDGSIRFWPEAVIEYIKLHIVQSPSTTPAVKVSGKESQNRMKRG